MPNNKLNNQSSLNNQQQQDLMQAAALMFPSLFMAHQANQVFNNSSTNLQQQQQSLLQNFQSQQNLQQQQSYQSSQNKLLASLIQQQNLAQQNNSNDFLKLLNIQSNKKQENLPNAKNVDHKNSSPSPKPSNIEQNINSTERKVKQLEQQHHGHSYKGNGTGSECNKNTSQTSRNQISMYNESNKLAHKNEHNRNNNLDSPSESVCSENKSHKKPASMFSIKDLIGPTHEASSSTLINPKNSDNDCKSESDCLYKIQKDQKSSKQPLNNQPRNSQKGPAKNPMNSENNKQSENGGQNIFNMSQNDHLIMLAAATAVMQNSNPNIFQSKNVLGIDSSSNLSYDLLLQMAQQQEKSNKISSANNLSRPNQQQQAKTHHKSSKSIGTTFKHNSKISHMKLNTFYENGHHNTEKYEASNDIEEKIKAPLKYGWRRETIVKEVHKNGIKGDVIYYSPCSKKLRAFQDIERYLIKNEKDLDGRLTRENFTFSSKWLIGNFMLLKESDASCTISDKADYHEDKLKTELKFDILNAEEMTAKICELNPNFRSRNSIKYSNDFFQNEEYMKKPTIKLEDSYVSQGNNHPIKASNIYEFSEKNQSCMSLIKHEMNNKDQINSRYERHQQEQRDLMELKRQEKLLQRERKAREKWFEYVLTREQHPPKHQIQQIISDDAFKQNGTMFNSHTHPFETIDDMQEKFNKSMPDFNQIVGDNDDKIDWMGDAMQVIEFLNTFGPKLSESLNENENGAPGENDSFANVLSSIESFRLGICNKNEKLKREITQIAKLLVMCLVNTIGNTKSSLIDQSSEDFYLINKITNIECNDITYSEIMRLYIKRSYCFLRKRRELTSNKFNIDVTLELFNRLETYLENLSMHTFEFLGPKIKVGIMAYLCDELLSTSPIEDLNNLHNQEMIDENNDDSSCVVYDLDEAIDEFHSLRQEVCQLDSKRRQLKAEKQTINIQISAMPEDTKPADKDKQQKAVNKLDKTLTQLEKKRVQLKNESEKCSNRLRSGKYLGQDRYLRHYWSLSSSGAIHIEASGKSTAPGTIYYSDDSKLLADDPNDLLKFEDAVIKDVIDGLIDKVEQGSVEKMDETESETIKKYSHLVERLSSDNPFKLSLNTQNCDAIKLTFRQIEQLIRNEIQYKQPQRIDEKYLSIDDTESRSKWWVCDNETLFKQLIDCLSKRGYREKALLKCLNKLNEENQQSVTDDIDQQGNSQNGPVHAYGKLKEFISNINETSTTSKSNTQNIQIYREQMKVLKYVYSLEDRVFTANLQQPAVNEKSNTMKDRKNLKDDSSDSPESEQPIDVAVERLIDLERRIERRYLKYPFVPKKKLANLKLIQATEEPMSDEESSHGKAARSSTTDESTVSVTEELEKWRRLVLNCKTTSRLYILVDELSESIAWDKSIMKVICQICNSDSNEDKLLLCDNCDKGNHTYCFKPKLENIPEGDWYCFVCVGLLSNGQKLCCVCGSSENFCPYEATNPRNITNDLNKCDKCSKYFHGQCLPLAKQFKTTHKWHCLNCHNIKPTTKVLKTNLQLNNGGKSSDDVNLKRGNVSNDKRSAKKLKVLEEPDLSVQTKKTAKNSLLQKTLRNTKASRGRETDTEHNSSIDDGQSESKFNSEQENNNLVELNNSPASKKSQKTKKGKRLKKSEPLSVSVKPQKTISSPPATPPNHVVRERDIQLCRSIVNEMAKNENAVWFLEKVDEKENPDYYEHIKQPMDIESIKNKLKNKIYKTKEQFAYDCRLIFDNCEFFNEDDSKIGQAGHKLRVYFETKWMKVFD